MALTVSHFRFGADDGGTESTHGWHAAEDTNPASLVIMPGTQFLLRFTIQADASSAANILPQFQYRLNSGAWTNVTTTSSVVRAVAVRAFANGAACTKRLSGTGTFVANNAGCTEDGSAGSNNNDITANGNTETECGLEVQPNDVVSGDVIDFRITTTPTAISTYSFTPSVTIAYPTGSPRVAGRGRGGTATTGTSHTVDLTLAGTPADGDLFVIIASNSNQSVAQTWPAGWNDQQRNSGGLSPRHTIAYKEWNTGDATSFNVTAASAIAFAYQVIRVKDWYGDVANGVAWAGADSAGAFSTTPDPPNLTPSWGSKYNLWFATCSFAGGGNATAPPSGWQGWYEQDVGAVAVCDSVYLNETAASKDPGTYTTPSQPWAAYTIAVRPAPNFVEADGAAAGVATIVDARAENAAADTNQIDGYAPDTVVSQTNWTFDLNAVDEGYNRVDGVVTTGSGDVSSALLGFPTPPADLVSGANLQKFMVKVRPSLADGSIVTIDLYENGSFKANLFDDVLSDATAMELPWNASLLSDPSGAGVQIRFADDQDAMAVDVVEWWVTYAGETVNYQDGDGASAGAATAAGVSGATASSTAASDGVAAGTAIASATALADGASAGIATVTATAAAVTLADGASTAAATATAAGESIVVGTASAAGAGQADGVGAAPTAVVGAADGAAVVTGVSSALAGAVGTVEGVAAATGVGAALTLSDGTAAGLATASAASTALIDGTASAAGVAAVSAVGASVFAAVSIAAGTAQVDGVAAATAEAAGSSAGVGQATGVGAATVTAAGAADGLAATIGVGAAVAVTQGASSALAAVLGVATAIWETTATAEGTSSANADFDGSGAVDADGTAAGTSTATAASSWTVNATASAAGVGAADAIAAALVAAEGSSTATSSALAVTLTLATAVGAAAGGATVLGEGENAGTLIPEPLPVYIGASQSESAIVASFGTSTISGNHGDISIGGSVDN